MVIFAPTRMRPVHWIRFTWDLNQLLFPANPLPAHYTFRDAAPGDERELRTVITRSFGHDSTWGEGIHEVNAMVEGWLEHLAEPEREGIYLTLRHGVRIIGAAILLPDPAAANNLAPGPCVLMEYRNRGLGSALLGESLRRLHEAGLTRASALTQGTALCARFLYPKFNGVLVPNDRPLLAA